MEATVQDVIVIGGGQAGLACGYYLKKANIEFIILDDQEAPGGAWRHGWRSLTLFSPAEVSSLPGWLMPRSEHPFPTREEVISYLSQYEARYKIPVERPVTIHSVTKEQENFIVQSDRGVYSARCIISATGTWRKPYIPDYPHRDRFRGKQLHSAHYQSPEEFAGKRVLVVGEGNSGAQILAEVSRVANTTWIAKSAPVFLPDDVDGRVLFQQSSARYQALAKGETQRATNYHVGNIVMVPPVREARERGVLVTREPFKEFYEEGVIWSDGTKEKVDIVIWCTGFTFALDHLDALGVKDSSGRINVEGTRSLDCPGLWLVGYGGWTGYASSTLIGVGRTAKKTAEEIQSYLSRGEERT